MRVRLSGDGHHLHHLCKLKAAAWKAGYEKMMHDIAVETATRMLNHSYPAPGNDPTQGKGNTQEAKAQGEYNLRKDIEHMFYPLDKHSVKELVGMRNNVVFQLDNPIQWRDPDLERAWKSQDMDILFMAFQSLGTYTGESDWLNLENTMFNEVQANTVNYVEVPNEEIHQSSMKNGRWDGKTKTAVRNKQVIEQFLRRKMRDIGRSANGWVDILKKLGSMVSSVLPGRGSGTLSIKQGGGNITYSMENLHGNPNGMLTDVQAKVLQDMNTMLLDRTKQLVDTVAKIKPPPRKRNRGGGPRP